MTDLPDSALDVVVKANAEYLEQWVTAEVHRMRRDRLVREAVEAGFSAYRVAQALGVPTSTVTRIVARTDG